MLLFMVYLASIATGLKIMFSVVGGIACLFVAIALEEKLPTLRKHLIRAIAFISLAILIPSEKGVYRLLAVYGATEAYEALSQSEDAKRIAGKSLEYLESVLDEELEK